MVDRCEHQLAAALAARAERRGLAAAYLFGSAARGEARAGSDLDVAILYDRDAPATLDRMGFDLAAELMDETGKVVDLIVLDSAPVDLVIRVLREGRLLLDRDHRRRILFEVRSRNRHWDLEPYLRLYRRQRAAAV